MKFSLFQDYGAMNSKPVFKAFEKSLRSAGYVVKHNSMKCDVAVIWSILFHGKMYSNKHVWDTYRESQRPVVVLEIGGIARNNTWRVGLNGINREAYFSPKGNDNTRAKKLGLELRPWRKDGEYILICGQHEKSLQWHGKPRMSKWVMQTIDEIRSYTDRKILFRPHPRCMLPEIEKEYRNVYRQEPLHVKGTYDDYDLKFNNIWAVINDCSNPAPQAVIQGIPVFTSPSSIAYDVANHNLSTIENPDMPDRQQWLNDYAHTEYTIPEIEQGIPLKHLTNYLNSI